MDIHIKIAKLRQIYNIKEGERISKSILENKIIEAYNSAKPVWYCVQCNIDVIISIDIEIIETLEKEDYIDPYTNMIESRDVLKPKRYHSNCGAELKKLR